MLYLICIYLVRKYFINIYFYFIHSCIVVIVVERLVVLEKRSIDPARYSLLFNEFSTVQSGKEVPWFQPLISGKSNTIAR